MGLASVRTQIKTAGKAPPSALARVRGNARLHKEIRQLETDLDEDQEGTVLERATRAVLGNPVVSRVLDIVSRPNYAIAGVYEEIAAGHGFMSASTRLGRELLSGIGDIQGEKQAFGAVFQDLGYGEGGSLSGLVPGAFSETGSGLKFQRGGFFDWTARGSLGLALDIVADPTTYLTLGTAATARQSVKAGAHYLSRQGRASLKAAFERNVRAGVGQADADRLAREFVGNLIDNGAKNLQDKGGIKLFGQTIVPGEVISTPARSVGQGITKFLHKSSLGEGVLDIGEGIGRVFNRDFPVRDIPDYVARKQLYLTGMTDAQRQLREFIEDLFRDTKTKDRVAVTNFLDSGGKTPLESRFMPVAKKNTDEYARMAGLEQELELLDQVRLDYVFHAYDKPPKRVKQVMAKFDPKALRATLRGSQQARSFDTLEEARKLLSAEGINPIEDAAELLLRRGLRHIHAVHTKRFFTDVAERWGVRALPADLEGAAVKVSSEMNVIGKAIDTDVPGLDRLPLGTRTRVVGPEVRVSHFTALPQTADVIRAGGFRPEPEVLGSLFEVAEGPTFLGVRPSTRRPSGKIQPKIEDALQGTIGDRGVYLSLDNEFWSTRDKFAVGGQVDVSFKPNTRILVIDSVDQVRKAMTKNDAGNFRIRPEIKKQYDGVEIRVPDEFADKSGVVLGDAPFEEQFFRAATADQMFVWRLDKVKGLPAVKAKTLLKPTTGITAAELNAVKAASRTGVPVSEVAALSDEGKKVFLAQRFERVNNALEMENTINKYREFEHLFPETTNTATRQLKAFNGERMATLDLPEFKGITVPENLARDIVDFNKHFIDKDEVVGLLRAYDKFTNGFKVGVTVIFPAFHFRNGYSNQVQAFTDIGIQALNLRTHADAVRMLAGDVNGSFTARHGRVWGYGEVVYEAQRRGVIADYRNIFETFGDKIPIRTGTSKTKQFLLHPVDTFKRFGGIIENEGRLNLFTNYLRRGLDPETASQRVNKILFDYKNLSRVERDVLARFFPFYRWTRKNIALQAERLARNPGQASIQAKLTRQNRTDPRLLPKYLRGDMVFTMEADAQGNLVYVRGFDLPITDLNVIGAPLQLLLGNLSPAIKLIPELATDLDFFRGQPISEKSTPLIRGLGPIIDLLPDRVKKIMDFNKRETKEGTEYRVNPTLLYILIKSWALSRIYGTAERLMRAKSFGGPQALDLTTGFRLQDVDVTTQVKRLEQEYKDFLEKKAVAKGIRRRFDLTFRPKGGK